MSKKFEKKKQTQWWFHGAVDVVEGADAVSVHVTPRATLDTAHIPDFDAEWLVHDCRVIFGIGLSRGIVLALPLKLVLLLIHLLLPLVNGARRRVIHETQTSLCLLITQENSDGVMVSK